MSDRGLRELERAWAASGDVADEAAYLLGRVRAGELDRTSLELAAYLAHPAAQLALPEAPRADPGIAIDRLVEGLLDRSGEAQVRGYVAAAGLCLGAILGRERQVDDRLRGVLEAAERWCACPCADHARAARERANAVRHLVARLIDRSWEGPHDAAEAAALLAWRAASAVGSGRVGRRNRDLYEAGLRFGNVGERRAKQAVREALVPWLLAGNPRR